MHPICASPVPACWPREVASLCHHAGGRLCDPGTGLECGQAPVTSCGWPGPPWKSHRAEAACHAGSTCGRRVRDPARQVLGSERVARKWLRNSFRCLACKWGLRGELLLTKTGKSGWLPCCAHLSKMSHPQFNFLKAANAECIVHTYVHMYVCTYVRMYVCMYVCIYVCKYVYICTYVRMHV